MTQTPHLFPLLQDGMFKDALIDPFNGLHTTGTAENIAKRFHVYRKEQDDFASASQKKCEAARKEGRFDEETIAVARPDGAGFLKADETPRNGVTSVLLSRLKPTSLNGTVTAGNSSGIADGSSAVMLMRRKARPQADGRYSLLGAGRS